MTMTLAQKVREKYGDTVEQFAFRLGVTQVTVTSWEKGSKTNSLHSAILEYANKYEVPMKQDVPDGFDKLSASDKIDYLMAYFCCGIDALAVRLRVDKNSLRRWKSIDSAVACAERYLCEAVIHPERFKLF